jgi:uncharacterized membrane protein YheB (UPF0754 family)
VNPEILLLWVVPPLLGALIGYVTNKIAIMMLFRPHREYRIWKIRIPFTPGIIPRQRGELAKKIAETVSQELINEESLKKQFNEDKFQDGLESALRHMLDEALNFNLQELTASGENSFADVFDGILESLDSVPLTSILPDVPRLENMPIPFEGKKGEASLALLIGKWYETHKDDRLARYLRKNSAAWIVSMIHLVYPRSLETISKWLVSKKTHGILTEQGRKLLKSILDKLNTFQRIFVSAGQYDKTLDERMDSIVHETIQDFQSTAVKNQDHIVYSIESWISELRTTKIADLVKRLDLDEEQLPEMLAGLIQGIFRSVFSPKTIKALVKSVGNAENLTIGAVLRFFFGSQSSLPEALRINDIISLGTEQQERIIHSMKSTVTQVIVRQTPNALKAIDFHNLVETKINSLDMKSVEALVLRVVEKQLKWINLFGAMLGAVIGLAQGFIRLILP